MDKDEDVPTWQHNAKKVFNDIIDMANGPDEEGKFSVKEDVTLDGDFPTMAISVYYNKNRLFRLPKHFADKAHYLDDQEINGYYLMALKMLSVRFFKLWIERDERISTDKTPA